MLLAFGLAIALKAKEASLWEDLGTLNPTLAPFDNVPDFINWFLFVVSSPFHSLSYLPRSSHLVGYNVSKDRVLFRSYRCWRL